MYHILTFHSSVHVPMIAPFQPHPLQFPSAGGSSYQTLQRNLSAAAAALNISGSEVVAAARITPEVQAETTQKFASQFEELLSAGLTLAGASKDKESRNEMLGQGSYLQLAIFHSGA